VSVVVFDDGEPDVIAAGNDKFGASAVIAVQGEVDGREAGATVGASGSESLVNKVESGALGRRTSRSIGKVLLNVTRIVSGSLADDNREAGDMRASRSLQADMADHSPDFGKFVHNKPQGLKPQISSGPDRHASGCGKS
jgi:hypothetical protein